MKSRNPACPPAGKRLMASGLVAALPYPPSPPTSLFRLSCGPSRSRVGCALLAHLVGILSESPDNPHIGTPTTFGPAWARGRSLQGHPPAAPRASLSLSNKTLSHDRVGDGGGGLGGAGLLGVLWVGVRSEMCVWLGGHKADSAPAPFKSRLWLCTSSLVHLLTQSSTVCWKEPEIMSNGAEQEILLWTQQCRH